VPLLLILIFIGVPILEIALFIQAGDIFGLWPTLAAIVATAIIGGALIRKQGLATIDRARRSVDQGQAPVQEVFTGICLLIAGALLMTPGFLTDSAGFLLLIPPFRRVLGQKLMKTLFYDRKGRVWVDGEEVASSRQRRGEPPRDAIDVEFTEVPPDVGELPPKD
jgi:UPF0716 protein FxsA